MCLCCSKSKFCIYFSIVGHMLINIFFLVILLLSTYNISILNWYQYIYFVLSIINWIILIIYSIAKLFLITFGKFSQNYYPKKIWLFTHIPALIIIGIALIYDLYKVTSTSGIVGLIMYYFIISLFCILFITSSLTDLYGIQNQIDLSQNKLQIPLKEESDANISKKIN